MATGFEKHQNEVIGTHQWMELGWARLLYHLSYRCFSYSYEGPPAKSEQEKDKKKIVI